MAIQVDTKIEGFEDLQRFFKDAISKFDKEIKIAINKTAKSHIKQLAKPKGPIRSKVAISPKGVKESLLVPRQATANSLSATVRVQSKRRPSLKEFGAKQTKKGVSYRIAKGGKRQMIQGAFINQKMGGHAFKRKTKKRFPLSKMHGVSVWGVYTVNDLMNNFTVPEVSKELSKQIMRRLQFNVFKKKKNLGLV